METVVRQALDYYMNEYVPDAAKDVGHDIESVKLVMYHTIIADWNLTTGMSFDAIEDCVTSEVRYLKKDPDTYMNRWR